MRCEVVLVSPSLWYFRHAETDSGSRDVSYRQHGGDEGFQPSLKELICDTDSCWVLCRRKRILDHVLDVQIRPYLVEILSQVDHLGVGEHNELHTRGRLVVMELVFAGAVGEEGVVFAAEFRDQVAQGEDKTEDQLLIVGESERLPRGHGGVAIARDARC
jgi:hypothetical protein